MVKGSYTVQEKWIMSQKSREKAVASHQANSKRDLTEHTVLLPPLKVDYIILVQNQTSRNKLTWDSSGVVIQVLLFDQYQIRIDGSQKITLRNRKNIRWIVPPLGPKLV